MHLIHVNDLCMQEFLEPYIPPYVILSHRWEDGEVTFEDFKRGNISNKKGAHKILNLCMIAQKHNIKWVWLDTCCIDKRNSTEVSEAINSMYKWYENSEFCVAYLFDVDPTGSRPGVSNDIESWLEIPSGLNHTGPHEESGGARDVPERQLVHFLSSSWFTRSWTLQELIAPSSLVFYAHDWTAIGTKSGLKDDIAGRTGIDQQTLEGADPRRCSIARRMSWAAGRKATRIEDEAYSLLGLFDISLPMLYGEGERAFMSLQKAIIQATDDQSIFAWDMRLDKVRLRSRAREGTLHGLLARTPAAFANCSSIETIPPNPSNRTYRFAFTPLGVELSFPIFCHGANLFVCALECFRLEAGATTRLVIFLEQLEDDEEYARVQLENHSIVDLSVEYIRKHDTGLPRRRHVRQIPVHAPVNLVYGFFLHRIKLPNCGPKDLERMRVWSAMDGSIALWQNKSCIKQMPRQCSSLAVVILLPQSYVLSSGGTVKWIGMAFDRERRPVCVIGNNSRPLPSRKILRDPFNMPVGHMSERWKDIEPFHMSKPSAPAPAQIAGMLSRFEMCVFSGDKTKWQISLPRYRISIGFSQNTCPPEFQSEIKSASGSPPWNIWTVEIQAFGDFDTNTDIMSPTLSQDAVAAMKARRVARQIWTRIALVLSFTVLLLWILLTWWQISIYNNHPKSAPLLLLTKSI